MVTSRCNLSPQNMYLSGGFILRSPRASEREHFCFERQREGTFCWKHRLTLLVWKKTFFLTHNVGIICCFFMCLNYLRPTKLECRELIKYTFKGNVYLAFNFERRHTVLRKISPERIALTCFSQMKLLPCFFNGFPLKEWCICLAVEQTSLKYK